MCAPPLALYFHNTLHSMPGLRQWDTAAVYKVMHCMLQCGHALDAFWQYGEPSLPAMLQLTAQQVGALLQVSLDSGCCGSISSLWTLPGAAALQPQLVVSLCRAVITSYPCSRASDVSYVALEELLALAAAQSIDAAAAAQLLSAAQGARQAQMAALLQQQLPQLQDAAAAAAADSSGNVHPLLQQLRKAVRSRQMKVVKQMCQSQDLAHVAAADRGALLVEALYAVRGHDSSHDSLRELAWDKESTLLCVIPGLLPPQDCTAVMFAQLLQACSASGCTRTMLQLIEHYPAADQLSAADLEPLLLQCMAWETSKTIHVDDERPQVILALLQLPGAQGVSVGAISKLVAAMAASGTGCGVNEVLELPAAGTMSAAAVCDAVEACLNCPYAHLYMQEVVKQLMQIGAGAGLSAEQLRRLLVSAMQQQQQQHWALEDLLKHPAAPVDRVLVGWARECLEVHKRMDRRTQGLKEAWCGSLK